MRAIRTTGACAADRFRVEAEAVRDIALSVSGLMVDKFGGPSAKPYQAGWISRDAHFPKREYSASRGRELYRRGSTPSGSALLHPAWSTFDAPTRGGMHGKSGEIDKPRSVSAAQRSQSRGGRAVFAAEILKHGGKNRFGRFSAREPSADRARRAISDRAASRSLADSSAHPMRRARLITKGEAPVSHDFPHRTSRHDHGLAPY